MRDQFETVLFMDGKDVLARHDPSSEISFIIMDGSILKHGKAEWVQKYLDDGRAKVADSPAARSLWDELEIITMKVETISDEMFAEINACLSTTGRAARLVECLSAMEPRPQIYSAAPGF